MDTPPEDTQRPRRSLRATLADRGLSSASRFRRVDADPHERRPLLMLSSNPI